jgi:hypothetical protein
MKKLLLMLFLLTMVSGGNVSAANLIPNPGFEQTYTCGTAGVDCLKPVWWQRVVVSNVVAGGGGSTVGVPPGKGAYIQIKQLIDGVVGIVEIGPSLIGPTPYYLTLSGNNAFSITTYCNTPLVARLVYPATASLPAKIQYLMLRSAINTPSWVTQSGRFTVPAGYSRAYLSLYIYKVGICYMDNVSISHIP